VLSPGWAAWAAGALTAFLLTPPVRRLAERRDVLDRPDRRRKLHRRLVPLWGGLAVWPALLGGIAVAWLWTAAGRDLAVFQQGLFARRMPWLVLALTLLLGIGLVDDKLRIPPKVKLLVHLTAAGIVAAAGFRLEEAVVPFSGRAVVFWPFAGVAFSVLWITFITNAYNFMDGLDGLASGQAVIAGVAFALGAGLLAAHTADPAARQQAVLAAILAAAAAGAALGFWRYNKPPARIFLGDAGSTLLGFTLALAALIACGRATSAAAPLLPLLVFGWPILDTLLAVFRRWSRREPVSKADHCHLHHRLQDAGFTPGAAAAFILMLGLVLAALGLTAAWL